MAGWGYSVIEYAFGYVFRLLISFLSSLSSDVIELEKMRSFIHLEHSMEVKLMSLSRDKSTREGFPAPATKDGGRQVAPLIMCFDASVDSNPMITFFGTLSCRVPSQCQHIMTPRVPQPLLSPRGELWSLYCFKL